MILSEIALITPIPSISIYFEIFALRKVILLIKVPLLKEIDFEDRNIEMIEISFSLF